MGAFWDNQEQPKRRVQDVRRDKAPMVATNVIAWGTLAIFAVATLSVLSAIAFWVVDRVWQWAL